MLIFEDDVNFSRDMDRKPRNFCHELAGMVSTGDEAFNMPEEA
jgi:hypothetical protein